MHTCTRPYSSASSDSDWEILSVLNTGLMSLDKVGTRCTAEQAAGLKRFHLIARAE